MKTALAVGGGSGIPTTTATDGNSAANVVVADTVTIDQSNHPSTFFTFAAETSTNQADNAVVFTSGDVTSYDTIMVQNTSSTDGITLQVSLDGTTWAAVTVDAVLENVTGNNITPGEVGKLRGKYKGFRCLKNGATAENPSIIYALGVSGA